MTDFIVFGPLVVSLIVGAVIFLKSWASLPISGLIAFMAYLMLGVVSLGWFSSTPMSSTAILLTLESVTLAGVFTWRVWRWC